MTTESANPPDELVRRARAATLSLLEQSSNLENGVLIPYGQRVGLAIVGMTIRVRRLARSVVALVDRGESLEAQILLRTMLEYVITIEWILKDPKPRVLSWWTADERGIDAMVSEVTTMTGISLDIPPDQDRAQTELDDQIARDAAALNAPQFPSLQARAAEVEAALGYSLFFRLYSQGGTHAYRQGLVALLEDKPEVGAVLIRAQPKAHPIDDPYYLAGVFLVIALERLTTTEPGLLRPDVTPLKQELLAIKDAIDAA